MVRKNINMSDRTVCKLIALLCALALILCGCVACGEDNNDPSPSQDASSDIQISDDSQTGEDEESTSFEDEESTTSSKEEEVTGDESISATDSSAVSKTSGGESQATSGNPSKAGSSTVTSKETSSKKTETSSKKPEISSKKPEASSTKPEVSSKVEPSSVAPTKTPIEIITAAIDKLNHASAAKLELSGTTVANAGIKLNQTTESVHIVERNGSSVKGYCTNVSKSSFVDTDDVIRSDGKTCTVTDNKSGNVTKYSYSEYIAARGPLPEELIPYKINAGTLKPGSKVTSEASGNNTVYSLSLNINKAATNYKNALKANAQAGGATFKQIKNIDLTMTIDKNGNLISMTVKESYDMNKTVIVNLTVTCNSEFTYKFTTGNGISIPK